MQTEINIRVCGVMIKSMEKVYLADRLGVLSFANKEEYDGEWSEDKKEGNGNIKEGK